jgi:hypothetical protein
MEIAKNIFALFGLATSAASLVAWFSKGFFWLWPGFFTATIIFAAVVFLCQAWILLFGEKTTKPTRHEPHWRGKGI